MLKHLLMVGMVICWSTRAMSGSNAVDGREMEGDHFEGDIAMRSKPAAGGHGVMLAALRDTSKRWPGGRVPFRIDTDSIPNLEHHRLIRSAMDKISHKVTCIKFVENQKLARPKLDFIRIASDGDDKNSALGCWSYLGMIGGEQTLNLDGNCFQEDVIVHELLHALSFIHEQNRSDRDNYVEIQNEHIKPGMEDQFIKRNESDVNDNNTPYDFRSRLHYPPKAFTKSGEDTIVALYPGNDNFGPTDTGLSPIDIVEVSLLYDCPVNNKDIIEYIHQNRLANEMRIEILENAHFEDMEKLKSQMENIESKLATLLPKELYLQKEEKILTKANLITTIPKIGKEYQISVDFKATSIEGTRSMIHFSTYNKNDENTPGGRNPAVWIYHKKIFLGVDIGTGKTLNFHPSEDIVPTNQWINLDISQKLENGKYMLTVLVDGKQQYQKENTKPQEYSNVKVYAGAPWWDVVHGSIRNFFLKQYGVDKWGAK